MARSSSVKLIGRVLVVDDHAASRDAVADTLRAAGCVVEAVENPSDALARLDVLLPDVLVSDVRMPGEDGFSLLERVRAHDPLLPVVLMTGFASVPEAVRALNQGAVHYLSKPLDRDELLDVMRRALALQRARRAGVVARTGSQHRGPFSGLVGESAAMRALLEHARAIASQRVPVLITGEAGSGRRMLARAIYEASSEAQGPFVVVSCAGLDVAGLNRAFAEPAGALLLDEIGDLAPDVQAALMTAIDRAGAESGPRILALSRHDLPALVASGALRADLYHRLAATPLDVPPLRDRGEDLALLVQHFAVRLASERGLPPSATEPAATHLLAQYNWPGNVRELESVLREAVSVTSDGAITAVAVRPWVSRAVRSAPPRVPGATIAEIERHAILTTYEACGHNALRTAEVLGLAPRTVHYRLREYRGETGRRKRRGE